MNKKIWLSSPHMGGSEQKYIKKAFESNWIAPLGPNVDNFEQDLTLYCGVEASAALSSGTAALHLALILLGVKRGDEVICQSFTFSASANPIRYQGAFPVFIDSEPDTWNMDPDALENAIISRMENHKKPKAIILVHLYGMPAKMDEIISISKKYEIPIIEDAAEALGSKYNNKKCGSFGKVGILSFNGNKIITTSGGGALLSDDIELIDKARFLATQARDDAPHYQHSNIGYNYRMSNILAGIGRGQMEVLSERIKKKRKIHEYYFKELNREGIDFLREPKGYFSNRWLTTIIVNPVKTGGITREEIRKELLSKNIESRPLWKPMHLQPIYNSYPNFSNGVSEDLFNNGLCLPSDTKMSKKQLDLVINTIKSALSRGA